MQANKEPKSGQALAGFSTLIMVLTGAFVGCIILEILPSIAYRLLLTDGWEGIYIYLKALVFLALIVLLPTFVFSKLPGLLRRLGNALKNSQIEEDEVEKIPELRRQRLPSALFNSWFKRGICIGALTYWLRIFFLGAS